MARQVGPIYFTGTVGDLVFYKLGEHYYMRQKGDYNTKAVQKPGARPLMQLKQREFGRASALAKEVYWRRLPRNKRGHGVHGALTKIARQLLQQGKTDAEVKALVVPLYLGEAAKPEESTVTAPAEKPQLETPEVPTVKAPATYKKNEAHTGVPVANKEQFEQRAAANTLLIISQIYVPALHTTALPWRAVRCT